MLQIIRYLLCLSAWLLAGSRALSGVTCDHWTQGFGPSPVGGEGPLVVFDDGSGPALYSTGSFNQVSGIHPNKVGRVGKWDGTSWTPAGDSSWMFGGTVYALTAFDDGTGPALYAGGVFNGGFASSIAKWDGVSWSPLGAGIVGQVNAMAVYDDGTGPALYATGIFSIAGGTSASNIAKWDGVSWSGLGSGLSDGGLSLHVFDDGSGAVLYATGYFHVAGGVTAHYIARWDGGAWASVGSGGGPFLYPPRDLATFDDGTGDALYATSHFSFLPPGFSNVAKWNGVSWTPVGFFNGLGAPSALVVLDDGTGEALYNIGGPGCCGHSGGIARWDGSVWVYYAGAANPNLQVTSLCVFDDGSGPCVFAKYEVNGQQFTLDGVAGTGVAKWNGAKWSALSSGLEGMVHAIEVFNDGTGNALYVAGVGLSIGGHDSGSLVKWSGSEWQAPSGVLNATVFDLLVADLGTGNTLFAATQSGVVKWDGTSWTTIGGQFDSSVYSLAVYDDGTGPALYAGGTFTYVEGALANSIAKWSGTNWSPLGLGLGGWGQNRSVSDMVVHDDGAGESLFVAGTFVSAGGIQATGVARWNGTNWAACNAGPPGPPTTVGDLAVYDEGSGATLVATGVLGGVAKWNGNSWSAIGGVTNVAALSASGTSLYAARTYQFGGSVISSLMTWDGTSWHSTGETLGGYIYTLSAVDQSTRSSVFVGGNFESVVGIPTSCVAEWVACDSESPVWQDIGAGIPGTNGIPQLSGVGSLIGGSQGALTVINANSSAQSVLFVSLASVPVSFMGGTLVAYPVTLAVSLISTSSGTLSLPFIWPDGLSSNTSLFIQVAVADPGAQKGVALILLCHKITAVC